MRLSTFKGDWAVITGASSGIGREFARQLAGEGINTILVARRAALLDELARELEADFHLSARRHCFDLTSSDDAGHELRRLVRDQAITPRLLCNSAGIGRWGGLEEFPAADYVRIMKLNIMAPITICRHFFSDLTTFSSSVIINVSSQAAIMPVPFMSCYGASKAALHNFSLALGEEWAARGILVQTVVPGPTRTPFDNGRPGVVPKFVRRWDDADKIVRASLAGIEEDRRLVVTASGFTNQKIFWALAPASTALRMISRTSRPPDAETPKSMT